VTGKLQILQVTSGAVFNEKALEFDAMYVKWQNSEA